MQVLEIIKPTEKSKEIGFYKGEYFLEYVNDYGSPKVVNERHELYYLECVVFSGATVRIIEK